jgi:hypothetical protein
MRNPQAYQRLTEETRATFDIVVIALRATATLPYARHVLRNYSDFTLLLWNRLLLYHLVLSDLQLIFSDPAAGFINLVLEIVLASAAAVIAHAVNSNAIPFHRWD